MSRRSASRTSAWSHRCAPSLADLEVCKVDPGEEGLLPRPVCHRGAHATTVSCTHGTALARGAARLARLLPRPCPLLHGPHGATPGRAARRSHPRPSLRAAEDSGAVAEPPSRAGSNERAPPRARTASPPDPRASPPDRRASLPEPRASPPDPGRRLRPESVPPDPRASPPDPRASLPEPRASPPRPRASPPQPRASPPDSTASLPEPRASPPDPRASPPDSTASLPEPRASPPELMPSHPEATPSSGTPRGRLSSDAVGP